MTTKRGLLKSRITFLCIYAFLLQSPVGLSQPQESAKPFLIGGSYVLESKVLGQRRVIHVYEPTYYSSSIQSYPALYVLDGTENFGHTATLVEFLAVNESIPQMIVIGIASIDRDHDFLAETDNPNDLKISTTAGGADDFARFLSEELLPWVDRNYRTNSYRILFGHSYGGFFTLYTMLSNPDIFKAYLAASPSVWWNSEQLARMARVYETRSPEETAKVYITLGDEGADAKRQLNNLVAALQRQKKNGIEVEFVQLDQEKHTSTPHQTMYRGLQYIFDGWDITNALMMFEEAGIEGIYAHFDGIDQDFDTRRGVPAAVVRQLAGRLMEQNRFYEVADIIQSDPVNYPTHPSNVIGLASQFEAMGDIDKAIELYSHALRYSPSNQEARQKLSGLGVDVDALLDDVAPEQEDLLPLSGQYQMPNGEIWEFRIVDRGLVVYVNDIRNELVMLSPTSYTLGPGAVFMEFEIASDSSGTILKVRSSISDWETAKALD